MKKHLLLLLFACFFAQNLRAQQFEWAQVHDICPANMWQGASIPHLTTDGTNVISTATIRRSITFGSQTFAGGNRLSSYLAKHASDGNLVWANQMRGVVGAPKVTTDKQGNIIVAGMYKDSLQIGSQLLTAGSGKFRLFLAKFNPAGNLLWTRQSTSAFALLGTQVTTDGTGNVYVAATYDSIFSIGNAVITANGPFNTFLARFDPNGNFSWLKNSGGTDSETYPDILGGIQDGVILTYRSMTSYWSTKKIFLQRYNGTGGLEWGNTFPAGSLSSASLSMDAAQNLYLSGIMTGTVTFGNHTLTYNPAQTGNVYLAKISLAGHWKWARMVQSASAASGATLARQVRNELYLYRTHVITPYPTFNYEILISRLDTSGAITHNTTIGNLSQADTIAKLDLTAMAADNAGNLFISGMAGGKIALSPVVLNAPPPNASLAYHVPSAGFIAKLHGYPVTNPNIPAGLEHFRLYPNPANSYVKIEADLEKQLPASITVVNALGKTISQVKFAPDSRLEYQLPLNSLPKGMYIVKVETENGTTSKRLVIQ